jgi:protein-S-isoprenylcysteine O-methyltransferase Ste14
MAMNQQAGLITRLVVQNVLYVAGMTTLVLLPAGTLRWPAAWHFAIAMIALGIASGLWLAKVNPELLAERMRPMMQHGQSSADKKFMLMFGAAALVWLLAMGFEARGHVPRPTFTAQAFGLALIALSTVFILWVMRVNSFAAPVVKVQSERGHHVIDTGPYAWVRHPMYSGTFLFFCGMPIMLGSRWGLVLAPVFVMLFAGRTYIEERALTAGLPGYQDYVGRVRYRLIPGVW